MYETISGGSVLSVPLDGLTDGRDRQFNYPSYLPTNSTASVMLLPFDFPRGTPPLEFQYQSLSHNIV